MCTALIRKHISQISLAGKIIASAELLAYGRRNSVDKALSRMVKAGELIRIVRGQFVKPEECTTPGIAKVVGIKAARLGKTIFEHASSTAASLGLQPPRSSATVYAVCGASSSFKYGTQRITTHGCCHRKAELLADTTVGRTIKALWYLGRHQVTEKLVARTTEGFSTTEKLEFARSADKMPSWLWDLFRAWSW